MDGNTKEKVKNKTISSLPVSKKYQGDKGVNPAGLKSKANTKEGKRKKPAKTKRPKIRRINFMLQ